MFTIDDVDTSTSAAAHARRQSSTDRTSLAIVHTRKGTTRRSGTFRKWLSSAGPTSTPNPMPTAVAATARSLAGISRPARLNVAKRTAHRSASSARDRLPGAFKKHPASYDTPILREPLRCTNREDRGGDQRGEVAFQKGNVDDAAGWYKKSAAADPSWESPVFKLGMVALNRGDIEGAKVLFQKVIDLAPDSEEGAQAKATLAALP